MFNNFDSKINLVFFEVVCFCKYFVQQKNLPLYRLRWNTHYVATYLFSFHSTHPEVIVRLTAILKICWIPILYNVGSANAALPGRTPWLRNADGWRVSWSRWVTNWQKLSVKQHCLGSSGSFGGVNVNSGLIHNHYLHCVQGISGGLFLLVTTEAKVAVSTLAFSAFPLSSFSAPFSCGTLFFPCLPVADDIAAKSFFFFFHCLSPSLPYSTSFGLYLS